MIDKTKHKPPMPHKDIGNVIELWDAWNKYHLSQLAYWQAKLDNALSRLGGTKSALKKMKARNEKL